MYFYRLQTLPLPVAAFFKVMYFMCVFNQQQIIQGVTIIVLPGLRVVKICRVILGRTNHAHPLPLPHPDA